jgi:hypothetical protein
MDPMQRLLEFFKTFQQGEPLAVTKNRRDLTKGFVDNSEEGNDLGSLLDMNSSENPRELFSMFSDGFHTPANKQPSHPSFRLNGLKKQIAAQQRFPNQSIGSPDRGVVEQLLDIIGARK